MKTASGRGVDRATIVLDKYMTSSACVCVFVCVYIVCTYVGMSGELEKR